MLANIDEKNQQLVLYFVFAQALVNSIEHACMSRLKAFRDKLPWFFLVLSIAIFFWSNVWQYCQMQTSIIFMWGHKWVVNRTQLTVLIIKINKVHLWYVFTAPWSFTCPSRSLGTCDCDPVYSNLKGWCTVFL